MLTLTLTEAAKALGIQVRTMREWVKLGKIRAVKDVNGWYWKIPEEEINRCRQERRTCQKSSKA